MEFTYDKNLKQTWEETAKPTTFIFSDLQQTHLLVSALLRWSTCPGSKEHFTIHWMKPTYARLAPGGPG